jgi:hypothetical protein
MSGQGILRFVMRECKVVDESSSGSRELATIGNVSISEFGGMDGIESQAEPPAAPLCLAGIG